MAVKGIQRAPAVTAPTPAPRAHPVMPVDNGPHGVGSLMISSLPSMASGADVYARQFYRGSTVPFRRYLPIVKQQ